MKKARLTVLAGVNGAGKTTLRTQHPELFAGDIIVDADDYLRRAHGNWRRGNDRMAAVMKAQHAVSAQVAAHRAVTWETPLGGTARTALRLVKQGHAHGMTVRLIGVLVADAAVALQRVTARFQQGGIGGSQVDVAARFARGVANLRVIQQVADEVLLYTNQDKLRLVYEEQAGVVYYDELAAQLAGSSVGSYFL
ncbi:MULTISPECIES: AAA family ATPase [unclassified Ligilactobacillus]|uniref:AAA family ATPase n=1 Tax=unclassified Ligilactobacillus TaxID=2767920 RepID=UPI0038534259